MTSPDIDTSDNKGGHLLPSPLIACETGAPEYLWYFYRRSIQLMTQSTQHFENVFRKYFLNKKDWGMSETFKKHCFGSVRF